MVSAAWCNGTITLYTPKTIVILDDIRYANDPAAGRCVDMLGVIAGDDAIVADNGLNTPVWVKTGTVTTGIAKSMDDTPDLYLHSVIMALGTSFQVENYDSGPVERDRVFGQQRRARMSLPHRRPDSGEPWCRGYVERKRIRQAVQL